MATIRKRNSKKTAADKDIHVLVSRCCLSLRSQDLRAVRRDRDRMLVLGGQLAVECPRGPAVGVDRHEVGAFGDHRLDGDDHAFLETQPFAGLADMHVARILMQIASDAVREQVAHDAEAVRFGMLLDRARHVAEPIAGQRLRDAEVQAFLRDAHQLLGHRRDVPDRVGPGRVAEPAVQLRNGVDRDDIAVLERLIAREAMRDHVVDGGAGRILIALVALGERLRSMLLHDLLEDPFNLVGRNARLHERSDRTMAFGHDLTGFADRFDLLLALQYHHG
jgi:hypothetical protein